MYELLETYLSAAMQSEFFAGGIALGALGVGLALLGRAWAVLFGLALRRLCVSVTLDNRSPAFRDFCVWLDRSGALAHARRVRVTEVGREAEATLFAPAPGRHWFRHGGRVGILDREISEKTRVGGQGEQRPMETLTVTVPFGSVATIRGWIEEGRRLAETEDRIGPGIHLHRDGYWQPLGDVPRRPLGSVLCDDDRIGRLVADVRRFYGARDWYVARGVPWRRGYLLYGPPGTGKSSVIRAVASELGKDIATLDVGRAGLTDDELREAMAIAPADAILAVEDIDAVFHRREKARQTGVSFSGLLNAIDGVAAQEGRALMMTTNHRDRLDPALIRPGRADVHVELGPVGAETAARLFARFFPDEPALAARFRATLGDARLTPAALQGWLLAHADDPATAATAAGLVREKVLAAE